jgi:hypothetical protein
MRLFCQNTRVVELGFIENSLACFILNPFILVDQHQVDIPCSRSLGTISHIKGIKFENQVCDLLTYSSCCMCIFVMLV